MNRYRFPTLLVASGRRRRFAVVTIAALLLASALAGPPLIGIHYQDLTADSGREIEILIPRPALAQWAETVVLADAACLTLGTVTELGPGYALVLPAVMAEVSTCRARLEVSFVEAGRVATGEILVHLSYVDLPAPAAGTLTPTLGLSQMSLPTEAASLLQDVPLLSLLLANTSGGELRVGGPVDAAALGEVVGELFDYRPEAFDGSWPSLAAAGPARAAILSPGEQIGYALVLDPERRLPDGSSVVSIQVAVLVEQAGLPTAMLLDRLVAARGNELP